MAEPTTVTGVSITALLIALLGPLAGQYAVIVMAALAGSLWPLSTMQISSRCMGALFLIRIVFSAVFLSSSAAWYLEANYQLPAVHGMAVVAFLIGAMGNGWAPVFKAMREAALAVVRVAGGAAANEGQEK